MTEIEISPDNINQENKQEEVQPPQPPQPPKSQLELDIEKEKREGDVIRALTLKPFGDTRQMVHIIIKHVIQNTKRNTIIEN